MDWRKYIYSDFKIMMGKPVIVGTRITVELILEKVGAGETFEQLLEAHPRLTPEAIRAAIGFAADVLRICAIDNACFNASQPDRALNKLQYPKGLPFCKATPKEKTQISRYVDEILADKQANTSVWGAEIDCVFYDLAEAEIAIVEGRA